MSKVNYIYSTLSSDQNMVAWTVQQGSKAIPSSKVICVIAGKANIANKNFITPRGAVTPVSDEQLKALKEIDCFNQWVNNGFITIETTKAEADKVSESMTKKDKSAPLTEKAVKASGGKIASKE